MKIQIKKIIIKSAALTLCLALAVIAFSGCSSASDGVDYAFSYSLTANPKNLDPQVATDNNSLLVIKNLFEGLMRLDASGEQIPGVAESYQHNEDYTEFTFYLRRDAAWSDETPVTANDFKFAWTRALDPDTKSTTCSALFCIRGGEAFNMGWALPEDLGITIIDAYTLKVTLEYPYAEFPLQTTLAQFMPCNEVFFNSTKGHYGLDDKYLIANGPFYIEAPKGWNHDNFVRMLRNPYYVGENKVKPRIVYLGIRKSGTDYFSLLDRKVVEAAKIESFNVDKLEGTNYKQYTYSDKTYGVIFNTQALAFQNVNIRQAFARAVDFELYKDDLSADNEPAYDIVPPATKLNGVLYRELAGSGMKLAHNPDGPALLAMLKKGLREVYPDAYIYPNPKMPRVTMLCPDDPETFQLVSDMVQCWQDALILSVNIERMPEATLRKMVDLGQYQIAFYGISPTKDGPLACLQMFQSTNTPNPARLNDPAYDELISQAAGKTSTEEILPYLVAAEQRLNERAVFLPIYYDTTYYATWATVNGIYFSPFDGTADFLNATCTGK